MLDLNDQKSKILEFKNEEKGIGVIKDLILNFSSHIVSQVKKTNKIMGLIRRSYTHLDRISFRCLFNSLVRSIKKKKDKDLTENVLHWARKSIPGFYGKPCKQCLTAIGIPSTRCHIMSGDMILVHKLFHD